MVAESGANARALSAITRRRQRLTSSRGISAWARSISCGGNDLRTAGGGVDLFFQEEVQQCPEHDDRGKLADLVSCGRDGRPEKVRGELEIQHESQPTSQTQAGLVAGPCPPPP